MNDYLNLKQTTDDKVEDEKAKEPEVIDITKVPEKNEPQKVVHKVGVTAGGVVTATALGGMYLLSKGIKKVWEIAYPPKFKKYIAAATTVAFLYSVTHPVSTVKFIGEAKRDAVHWVEGVLSDKKDGDKAKEKATSLEKELNDKDRVVKDLTEKLGENIGLKFKYQKEAEIAKRELGRMQVEAQFASRAEKSIETTLQPYISPSIKGEGREMLVKPGATLADIAKNYLGDSSKWKDLANDNGLIISRRNGQAYVDLKVGDKIRFSEKYEINPNMEFLSNEHVLKYSFVKRRGESLESAIERNSIGIEHIDTIREYNSKLMPGIDVKTQERLWIPEDIGKKIFPAFPQKEIKEYPSRYNK